MKRLIFLISIILVASFGLMAQDRTVTINMGDNTYYNYTGSAADTLGPVDQDTIDIVFIYKGPAYVEKLAVKSRFDLRSGPDTTCTISVFGKEFSDDGTYVQIVGATSSGDINANNTTKILVSDPYVVEAAYTFGADSVTAAHNHVPFDISYRYYRVRYIHIGAASGAGTGMLIDDVEFKLYTK